MELHHCARCGESKPREMFSPRKDRKNGLMSWCRACMSQYISARYKTNAKHREQVKAAVARYDEKNPDGKRHRAAVRRAREMSAPQVEFTKEQLAQRWAYYGDRCWMCGDSAVGSDHVKPLARGGAHMLANLRPACQPCNSGKKDRWPYRRGIEF